VNIILTFPKAPISATTRGMKKERNAIVAPSILAADFSKTGEAVRYVEESGATIGRTPTSSPTSHALMTASIGRRR
jgi:hypothetical protein